MYHLLPRLRDFFSPASAKWMRVGKFFAFFLGLILLIASASSVFAADPIATAASIPMDTLPPPVTIDEKVSSLIFGLFIGVMLTAFFYLFFIWIVIRDRGQVFLMFLLLCLGVNMVSTNDLLMNQIGMHRDVMRDLLQNYSMILSYISGIFFTYYFLELEANAPEFRVPFYILAGLLIALLVYSVFDQRLVHFALPTLGTLTIACVLAAGVVTLRHGVSGSLTHIIAFLFFIMGGITAPLYDLGFISNIESSNNLTYASFSMAAMMFAIVIAGQFAARQEEKEKALAISNERFALATKGANEGLFDWNLQTGEVFFSDQFKKIIGMRLENSISGLKVWLRLIVSSDRAVVREALRRFRRNSGINAINVEYRVSRGDDNKRWLHSKAVATRDAETGKIIRLVGSTGDVTARKQGEVALRASEARFRSITEAHPVPVMIVRSRDGMVLYASPGTGQLLVTAQNELVDHSFENFFENSSDFASLLNTMADNFNIDLKEVTLRCGDGQKLEAALSARAISYQNQNAMVIGLYDLTERKSAEAQIARQQEALQQSEKMAALGGLLAGVAHELNNPLSVIIGQATLLTEGSQEPKVITRAEKIFKAADRCSRIVKSFLALARRKPPERRSIELNSIINNALELLGYQIKMENVEVVLDLDAKLPEVNGDGDQLTQVITNLVLNAAQAMQNWNGKRRLTINSRSDDNKHVVVKVIDTGPGIAPEIRSRIFEPFFTTKSSLGGTGVGLSLCINIVESHGGRLLLEETKGGGATFTIQLPMAQADQQTSSEAAQETIELPPHLKILLVDDEIEIAQTLADLLEPEGHKIDIAINGAVALQKVRQSPYDVIVSDLRMPVLDGPGLHAALAKELPQYIHKIIYVTGDTLSAHVQAFLNENPVPVVEKPYRLSDVRHAIAALLKENAGGRNMETADSLAAAHSIA